MVKLKCCNKKCNFTYSVSEKEFEEYGRTYHSNCMLCGSKLEIVNLEEIVKKDLYQRAEEYINKWISELGLEGCIELVERNYNQACFRIYKEILEKRGFEIK